jgi:hypothetical protein
MTVMKYVNVAMKDAEGFVFTSSIPMTTINANIKWYRLASSFQEHEALTNAVMKTIVLLIKSSELNFKTYLRT